MRPDPIDTAKRAVDSHYPGALGAFVGGSVVRGEGTATYDIDVVVLFDGSFEDVHVACVVEDGWPIEFFVHNVRAQDYYMEKDRRRGMCVLPRLIAEVVIVPAEHPMLLAQKDKARRIVEQGPPPLPPEHRDHLRYTLTALVDDLEGADRQAQRNAVLASLHDLLRAGHRRVAPPAWRDFRPFES